MKGRCGGAVARTAVCLVVVVVAVSLAPGWARADSVSYTAVRALAARAARGDPVALDRLRAVTSIDGRPAPLGTLLSAGTSAQIEARVLALAHQDSAPAVSSASARATAAAILRQPRYGKATVPNPLADVLRKLRSGLSSLASLAPGGPLIFWLVAAVLVIALSVVGARRTLRRLAAPPSRADHVTLEGGEDPVALALEAQSAEARGAFTEAIRLRFRAGLLTLGERDAIDYRPSLLTTDVADRLQSPQFDALAATFERVAYGTADARPDEAAAARDGWAALLSGRDGGR
jgi:hypothetical protein